MIITIKNPRNKLWVRFYDKREYEKAFGILTERERMEVAVNERSYATYQKGFGNNIYALPENTPYTQSGFNQNGADFRMNTYDMRTIIFEFEQFNGYASTQQTQVYYQDDHLLEISIQTEANTYHIKGSIIGDTSNGIMEIQCPNPFFNLDTVFSQTEELLINPSFIPLIPFELKKEGTVFFGKPQTQGKISFVATFPTDFNIRIEGEFDEITIKGITAGANITYKNKVKNNMIISTYDNTVIVDDEYVTQDIIGTFPTLIEGENLFEFVIPDTMQVTDVKITLSYKVVVANVE